MYETKLLVVTIKHSVVILAKPRARSVERQLTPIFDDQSSSNSSPEIGQFLLKLGKHYTISLSDRYRRKGFKSNVRVT